MKQEHMSTMLTYVKPVPLESQLLDFLQFINTTKTSKLLFAAACTALGAYAISKYLRQMTVEKLNEVYYESVHLWTDSKVIRELHKIMPKTEKFFKS